MTIKTRRRVFIAVLLLAMTLPAETILLKALQSPDDKSAASEWVNSLSDEKFSSTAANVRSYPFVYRQAIMKRLTPDRRSAIWQAHLERYIQEHSSLDDATVDALRVAQKALTPQLLSDPGPADRAAIHDAAADVVKRLGKEQADFLLYRIGPPDNTVATAEPLSMKLASVVRNTFVAFARNWDCECAMSWGCGGWSMCTTEEYCQWDVEWPMCGWAWGDLCDGMCRGY